MKFLQVILLMLLSAGCERTHSDMGSQDKYTTNQPSSFFANGSSARQPVYGAIARDSSDDEIPAITIDTLRAGQEEFEIRCAVCHGRLGNGQGMIVQRGFTPPPSFHIPRLKEVADSHLYNVITNGFGAMFSYADVVPPTRRWEIVAYIRLLQSAPDFAGDEFSETDRRALTAAGDRPPPTTGRSQ